MNTNISQFIRLQRLKVICRSLKLMLALYFGYAVLGFSGELAFFHLTQWGWFVFHDTYTAFNQIPWYSDVLVLVCFGVYLATLVKIYQLLDRYEAGEVFSQRNGRLLRAIGLLALTFQLTVIFGGAVIFAAHNWTGISHGTLARYLTDRFLLMVSSPWAIGGVLLIAFSNIQDEGCKLQEEQELTV